MYTLEWVENSYYQIRCPDGRLIGYFGKDGTLVEEVLKELNGLKNPN